MRDILDVVMSMYKDYNGSGMQMALFFACLIYLLVQKKDKEKRYLFLGYPLLFFVICFCPLTAKVIMDFCIGETVYWRMFWLLPTVVITAYTAVQVIMQAEEKKKRYLLLMAMLLAVGMTGSVVYNGTIFARKENPYKLPQDVVDICDIIEADAKTNGITHKKLITGNNLNSFIRQYDAQILMPYGEETIRGGRTENENAAEIFRIMSSEEKDWEALAWYASAEKCNYLAYPLEYEAAEELTSCGYTVVGDNGAYGVYRRDLKEEDENSWLIKQYGGADGAPLTFYTMQDLQGHLIVIDGGRAEDVSYVRKQIRSLGGHVDAWIITHPHEEHAGAFMEIYKKPKKITIDSIYAGRMPAGEEVFSEDSKGEANVYEQWNALAIPDLKELHAGDAFEVDGLAFQVFHAYDESVEELSDDPFDDGSLVFKAAADRESMLFCSDVGEAVSDSLLHTYGESLQADYIQMADHGNHGLKEDFYRKVNAKGAFFDAPNHMMQDMSGTYDNLQNAMMMIEYGAKIYSYATTPNRIVLN